MKLEIFFTFDVLNLLTGLLFYLSNLKHSLLKQYLPNDNVSWQMYVFV